jgi:hypothetical protein
LIIIAIMIAEDGEMNTLHTKGLPRFIRFISTALTILLVIFSSFHFVQASPSNGFPLLSTLLPEGSITSHVYMPIIQKPPLNLPIINIPYFEERTYRLAAVSWFGQVRDNENYADVRIGYTSEEIYVRVSVFDNYLWYDVNPDIHNLTNWDSITLYLDTNGNNGSGLNSTMFNFTRQLQSWDDGKNRQIAYQGSSSGWNEVSIPFSTTYDWRGNDPNDIKEDRGYALAFEIPFSSLGLSMPPDGAKWGAAITVHDRDNADGSLFAETYWPQNYDPSRSATWSQLSFGLPTYTTIPATNPQTITISNGLNGAIVMDGGVGGNTNCWWPGLDEEKLFSEWGDHTYTTTQDMNVQNQGNIDDWPCYSKFYITFPLDSLPDGQTVISATLTLHQSGQSTGFPYDPPEALNSLIQVSEIAQDWYKSTLTWNNGPIPIENVSQSWVGYIEEQDWGKASTWDLSRAVSEAYAEGKPLRLVVYSADIYGPNGKYFLSSDAYDSTLRPSLTVELGNP